MRLHLRNEPTAYCFLIFSLIFLLSISMSSSPIVYGQSVSGNSTRGAEPITLTAVSVGPRNSFEAKITWTPAELGQPNKFHVEIFDANQLEPRSPLSSGYDIKIYQGDKYLRPAEPTGNEAVRNEDFSQDFTFIFLQEGSYVLAIEEIQHEGENIRIPIQVTPEFPLGLFVVIAGLFASIITITRISLLHPKGNQ